MEYFKFGKETWLKISACKRIQLVHVGTGWRREVRTGLLQNRTMRLYVLALCSPWASELNALFAYVHTGANMKLMLLACLVPVFHHGFVKRV